MAISNKVIWAPAMIRMSLVCLVNKEVHIHINDIIANTTQAILTGFPKSQWARGIFSIRAATNTRAAAINAAMLMCLDLFTKRLLSSSDLVSPMMKMAAKKPQMITVKIPTATGNGASQLKI